MNFLQTHEAIVAPDCPDQEILRRAALGLLDAEDVEQLSLHLSDCRECWKVLESKVEELNEFPAGRGPSHSDLEQDSPKIPLAWQDPSSVPKSGYFGSDFRVIQHLGRGGAGDVYECFDQRLNRRVAVKILRSQSFTPRQIGRFQQEARLQATVNHPNFVQIYEVGDVTGIPFIAMELVDGGSLKQKLAEKPLAPRTAAALMATVARAIDDLHQQKLVHRDLKPSNILLTEGLLDPQRKVNVNRGSLQESRAIPKIADFGLAKILGEANEFSQSDIVVGTLGYLAPEQISQKNKSESQSSDIYSLGVILYETLTGTRPFQAETVSKTLAMIETATPVPPSQLQPGVSRNLETICLKCLKKDPRQRYGSARDLADDLQRFLEDRPIIARPTPTIVRLFQWSQRNWALAAAILATMSLGVLLVMTSLLFAWEQQHLKQLAEDAATEANATREAAIRSAEAARKSEIRALASEATAKQAQELATVRYNQTGNLFIHHFYHDVIISLKLVEPPLQDLHTPEIDELRKMMLLKMSSLQEEFFQDPTWVETAPFLATEMLYQISMVLRRHGERGRANENLEQAIQIGNRYPDTTVQYLIVHTDARNTLAVEKELLGKIDQAIELLNEAWETCLKIPVETYHKNEFLEKEINLVSGNLSVYLSKSGFEESAARILAQAAELRERVTQSKPSKAGSLPTESR
jgi:serine/threonine protein kinase